MSGTQAATTAQDTLVISVSEDAYQGDAQFTIAVDGIQQGSVYTAKASHQAGATEAFTVGGGYGAGPHAVAVTFINDAYGGTAATDRNLYVDQIVFNGKKLDSGTALLARAGTASFTVESPPDPALDTLVLSLSEDAYRGDAQYVVLVNGVQVGGVRTVTASHAAGASQDVTLSGRWGNGAHDVIVTFLNDDYGGTASTDRNLYVDRVAYNGRTIGGVPVLLASSGSASFAVPDGASPPALELDPAPTPVPTPAPTPATSAVTLHLSGDAYQGNARYAVSIDGVEVGTGSVTASNAAGQSQAVTFQTALSPGMHTVAVSFLNDAYGGTAATDRNLYVKSIEVNGTAIAGTSALLASTGTRSFQVPVASAPTPAPTPTPAPMAGFHVATGGNDSNDGSAARPFATLQRAATAMAGSSLKTTVIEGGIYSASLTLGVADSGTSFVAAAGRTVTLEGSATRIAVNGADHVTLSGLTFTGADGPAIDINGGTYVTATNNAFSGNNTGILLRNNASHNTITNNLITNTAFAGVEVKDDSHYNTIGSNMIDGVGPVAAETQGGAVYMHGASNNQIVNNEIRNTAGAGISVVDFYYDTRTQNLHNVIQGNKLLNTDLTSVDSGAIYILGRSNAFTDTLVEMNFIDGYGRPDQHSVGIYLDDNVNGATVQGNIIRGSGSDAVQIHGGSDNQITGNVIDLGTGRGSAVLFQKNPDDQPNPSPLQRNVVSGNIVYSESSAPGKLFANIDGGNPNVSGNDFFSTAGVALDTQPDTSPRYQDPGFADAAAGDYRLSGGAGIGFTSIYQSKIGLLPVGPHAY